MRKVDNITVGISVFFLRLLLSGFLFRGSHLSEISAYCCIDIPIVSAKKVSCSRTYLECSFVEQLDSSVLKADLGASLGESSGESIGASLGPSARRVGIVDSVLDAGLNAGLGVRLGGVVGSVLDAGLDAGLGVRLGGVVGSVLDAGLDAGLGERPLEILMIWPDLAFITYHRSGLLSW